MDSAQLNAPITEGAVQRQRKKGISGSTIKIIAVAAMLIDHVAAALLTRILIQRGLFEIVALGDAGAIVQWLGENGSLYMTMNVMRLVGRLGFPIFCFLLVEGFQKTRNVKKYALRLGLFALISEIPFDLACSGTVLEFGYQNVYFTLLLGILALWGFDFFAKHDLKKPLQFLLTAAGILLLPFYAALVVYSLMGSVAMMFGGNVGLPLLAGAYLLLVAVMLAVWAVYRKKKGSAAACRMCADMAVLTAAMLAADLLRTDYSGMGVLTIAVMYLFRRNKVASMTSGCVVLTLMSLSELPAFLTLIPVAFYNGERGIKMKYFFYAFYPVHLLIIWLIAAAMGMGWISAI